MKKWAVGCAGVAVSLLLVVVGIGTLLPISHRATSRIVIEAPIDSVWQVVRNLGDYPSWWDSISDARELRDSSRAEVWLLRSTDGDIPFAVEEEVPPNLLVTRIVEAGLPFGGEWRYDLAPQVEGTVVTVTEDGRVYNPVFRFVSRFLLGYHGTIDDYLSSLALWFGSEQEPVHVS